MKQLHIIFTSLFRLLSFGTDFVDIIILCLFKIDNNLILYCILQLDISVMHYLFYTLKSEENNIIFNTYLI